MSNTSPPAPAQAASWRDTIKVHPAANLFPMMSDEELDALAADIKENGLQERIVFYGPRPPDDVVEIDLAKNYELLDGRNRVDALLRSGIDLAGSKHCKLVYAGEIDPYAYVVSANIQRRHLTAEEKDDLIVKVLAATPAKSDREVAKTVKVDHKKVGRVRKRAEATGAVAPVEKRTGADGKTRKQPARKRATKAERAEIKAKREQKKQAAIENRTRQHEEAVAERKAAAAAFAVEIRDLIGVANFTWLAAGLMSETYDVFDRIDAIIDLAGGVNPWVETDPTDPIAASATARKAEAAADEALAGNDPGPIPAALDRTVQA